MEAPLKLTGQQSEITVLLSDKFGEFYKPFHCVICGNIVFEYNEDEIRTILPSGHPQLGKAGKVYRCNGVMSLHGTSQLYDILYQVMEVTFNLDNIEDIHTAMSYLSKTSEDKFNARCKARYFVS